MNTAAAIATASKAAAPHIAKAKTAAKNTALLALAAELRAQANAIVAANGKDMAAAAKLPTALKDRLLLDENRIQAMLTGIETITALPDPIGEINNMRMMPSGIRVGQIRVPLGVIFAIYESRPNVTADIAALAIKSGNAVILRGGKEANHSNIAIGTCVQAALKHAGLPPDTVHVVSDTARSLVDKLLVSDGIDLVIPRGGRGLIETVTQKARMPVLKHLEGNCHVYVDSQANMTQACDIVINAKTRRYGVCAAAESLLVHKSAAATFLPEISTELLERGVELRGCDTTQKIIGSDKCQTASEDDWRTEYLAPIISIKVVPSLAAAITHINQFGSGHTDTIVTDSVGAWQQFMREVDSSSVMLNASTAFFDS
jgi:glutamate-5-semialdehyde dehydrogenase